jgi:5-hydroxyisourate hydrolase
MSGGISIHAVDVVSGKPATGMKVSLWRLGTDPGLIISADISEDGTLPGPHVTGEGIDPGVYEVTFNFGRFYGQPGSFLGQVPFRFHVTSATDHIHLPIKFSPWGFALFRGA